MKQKYDLICIGTALVDSLIRGFDPEPISASGYRAESGELHSGGEAVNEAAAAAKLGLRTGILCYLGRDAAGALVENDMKAAGVDTGLIVREEEHATPVTTMFVRADGSRMSVTNQAHKYNFHPEGYMECFQQAKAITLGSLFRAPFNDPEIVTAVLAEAKKQGLMIFADTKLPNFRVLTLDDLADSLPLIDYITPNEDEACYYTGKEDPADMAEVFLGYGVKHVIIKLGPKGCYYADAEQRIALPACPIEAVDATGAGDNFLAGFASEILRGSSAREALEFANACGAICTTAVGAATALRSREQVLHFMKNDSVRA